MALGTTSATVGVASSEIVAANAGRRSLVIVNDSDTDVYLSLGGTAVLGSGIRLNAGGGTYEVARAHATHRIHVGAVSAIASAVSKNVTIEERDER